MNIKAKGKRRNHHLSWGTRSAFRWFGVGSSNHGERKTTRNKWQLEKFSSTSGSSFRPFVHGAKCAFQSLISSLIFPGSILMSLFFVFLWDENKASHHSFEMLFSVDFSWLFLVLYLLKVFFSSFSCVLSTDRLYYMWSLLQPKFVSRAFEFIYSLRRNNSLRK